MSPLTPRLVAVPDILDDNALTIYVDGSMYESPRRGGRGVLFVWVNDAGDEETWEPALPATVGATNNEMELEAPIEALRLVLRGSVPVDLARFNKIVIRTDSTYVHDNVPNAVWTWRKSGWTKKDGGAVLHTRTWTRLVSEMKTLNERHHLLVHFAWSAGKQGRHAKAVDKLAKRSAQSASFGRGRPTLARRKLTAERVNPGSVTVTGQLMTVRIVVATYLRAPHKRSRYKYEVVDVASPFLGKVDWAESELGLKQGRTYLVRMNDVQGNPRIEELVHEIEEDLTPYVDALKALAAPSTAQQVTRHLAQRNIVMSPDDVRRRLNRLVGLGVGRERAWTKGRPYVYEVTGT